MRKSRMGVFLIGLTVLALSAGVVAGMLVARLPAAPAENPVLPPPAFERSSPRPMRRRASRRRMQCA